MFSPFLYVSARFTCLIPHLVKVVVHCTVLERCITFPRPTCTPMPAFHVSCFRRYLCVCVCFAKDTDAHGCLRVRGTCRSGRRNSPQTTPNIFSHCWDAYLQFRDIKCCVRVSNCPLGQLDIHMLSYSAQVCHASLENSCPL